MYGVNRSNGFVKSWFSRESNRKAVANEAYMCGVLKACDKSFYHNVTVNIAAFSVSTIDTTVYACIGMSL